MNSSKFIRANEVVINHLFKTTNSTMILPLDIIQLISNYSEGCLYNIQGKYLRNEDNSKDIFDLDWNPIMPTNERDLSPDTREVIMDEFDAFQDGNQHDRNDVLKLFDTISIKTLNTNAVLAEWPQECYIIRFGFTDGDQAFLIIRARAMDINDRFSMWFFDGEDDEKDTILYGFI